MTSQRWLLVTAVAGVLLGAQIVLAQDDDDDAPTAAKGSTAATAETRDAVNGDAPIPALTPAQQDAVGIVVAHPQAATRALAIDAFGEVLDPAAIIADVGQIESARATAQAADADVARQGALYRADSAASLKTLEAARAEAVRAKTQVAAARSMTRARWGVLATMSPAPLHALLDAAVDGRSCLVRAVVPGRQSFVETPSDAVLAIDGAAVPAQVLGTLPTGAGEAQGVNLLLRIDAVPAGLGAGARMSVSLAGASQTGFLLPASALVYDAQGAHVYRQIAGDKQQRSTRFEAVKVNLLQHTGSAWLVAGVAASDAIAVDGVGALWSLAARDAIDNDDD